MKLEARKNIKRMMALNGTNIIRFKHNQPKASTANTTNPLFNNPPFKPKETPSKCNSPPSFLQHSSPRPLQAQSPSQTQTLNPALLNSSISGRTQASSVSNSPVVPMLASARISRELDSTTMSALPSPSQVSVAPSGCKYSLSSWHLVF
jgi:hypothetical protein